MYLYCIMYSTMKKLNERKFYGKCPLSLSLFVWGDLVSSCSDLLIHMLTFELTALIHSAIYLCVFMYCLPADTLQLRLFVRLYREKPVEIQDYSHDSMYVCMYCGLQNICGSGDDVVPFC